MEKLEFNKNGLIIDDKNFVLEYSIIDARIINNKAIVIFERDGSIPRFKHFNNCRAYNDNGKEVWIAEHPLYNGPADIYLKFMSETDNRLWNFSCFIVTLNFNNGKILSAEFTK